MLWNIRFDRFEKNFHYKLDRKPGPALVVVLPYLRHPKSKATQFYNMIAWRDALKASCLFVSDPGLTETIRGSWFQGTRQFFALDYLAEDIRQISKEFAFQESQTVLYGFSLGGFVALGLGAYLRQAKILAEGPQIDLRLINPRTIPIRNAAAQACYDVPDMKSVPREFQHRLSLPELYAQLGYIPHGKIWANETDTHCVDVQLPALGALVKTHFDVTIYGGEIGKSGHAAAPKDLTIREINALLKTGRPWFHRWP